MKKAMRTASSGVTSYGVYSSKPMALTGLARGCFTRSKVQGAPLGLLRVGANSAPEPGHPPDRVLWREGAARTLAHSERCRS